MEPGDAAATRAIPDARGATCRASAQARGLTVAPVYREDTDGAGRRQPCLANLRPHRLAADRGCLVAVTAAWLAVGVAISTVGER